ncbi:gamma-glutamylcyclotransferase family protein [Salipiger marinus]|uniref:ChaC-like protein n=1 Tax=Salipiger marinus TaxID=555512 RepID=A0A1G8IAE2_9RHOB|nr:gamma-glutamylcyclotransferase family protein [Salipiger marinus]SDI15856.1 hypothetical protein SAMN04487993_1001327 [Salipiger marinus]
MSEAYFFGYGSLVNRNTHGYAPCHTARATGWRRTWARMADRPLAILTVVPDPDSEIEGLIAPVPPEGWALLDLREAAYLRRDALPCVSHACDGVAQLAIYAVDPALILPPDAGHPLLLSYLDVVLQGYLREYGPAGAERFLDTTTGWATPVLDDRAQPVYPRAQTLTAEERAFVDDALVRLGARITA